MSNIPKKAICVQVPRGSLPESDRMVIIAEREGYWISFRYILSDDPFYDAHEQEVKDPKWRERMREKRWFTPELEQTLLTLV